MCAKKKISAFVFVLTALLILPALRAHSAGWGFYGTAGGGNFGLDLNFDSGGKKTEKGDAMKFGLGFSYDSNVAKDELLNYRLNVGWENVDLNVNHSSRSESYNSLNVDNTLGFGLFSNQSMRFWMGPELRLGYFKGSGNGFMDDARSFIWGLGGAVGLNMHLSQDYDLAFTTGVRWENYLNGVFDSHPTIRDSGDFDGSGTFGYFTATFYFKSLEDKYYKK